MATRTLRFLTLSQVQRLHARVVTSNGDPTQLDVLESAVHSPTNLLHYAKQEDVLQLAANLAEKIMNNHAFHDGNKRTGLVAVAMSLKVDGEYDLKDNDNRKGLADSQVAVIANQWDAERLGKYYESVAALVRSVDA